MRVRIHTDREVAPARMTFGNGSSTNLTAENGTAAHDNDDRGRGWVISRGAPDRRRDGKARAIPNISSACSRIGRRTCTSSVRLAIARSRDSRRSISRLGQTMTSGSRAWTSCTPCGVVRRKSFPLPCLATRRRLRDADALPRRPGRAAGRFRVLLRPRARFEPRKTVERNEERPVLSRSAAFRSGVHAGRQPGRRRRRQPAARRSRAGSKGNHRRDVEARSTWTGGRQCFTRGCCDPSRRRNPN